MHDDEVRMIDPPRAVEVRHDDGRWWSGEQCAWIRSPEGWRASVTYSAGVGRTFVRTVPESWVRLPETPAQG